MNRYPEIGETVKILDNIGADLENDRVGTVESRDGEYIFVRLNKSGVLCERYPCELEKAD